MTGTDLKAFMGRHHLDDRTLAGVIGVTPGTVNHWTVGRRSISLTVSRLLRTFDKYPQLIKEFPRP